MTTMLKEASKLFTQDGLDKVIEKVNELLDNQNSLATKLSLRRNFDGEIIEKIVIPAGVEKDIPHKLGNKPKHRIILNQEGNGVISDIPSGWNQYKIKLKNNGAVSVTLTIMIVRE